MIHFREKGLSLREIGESMACRHSKPQVRRVLQHYYKYGKPPAYGQHKRETHSERKLLTADDTLVLISLYEKDPSLYLDEAVKLLNLEVCYNYSATTVWRSLQKEGLTWKRVSPSLQPYLTDCVQVGTQGHVERRGGKVKVYGCNKKYPYGLFCFCG